MVHYFLWAMRCPNRGCRGGAGIAGLLGELFDLTEGVLSAEENRMWVDFADKAEGRVRWKNKEL